MRVTKVAPIPEVFTVESLANAFWITCNEKTGISIDMPAKEACPGMTEACTERLKLANGEEGKMLTCYAMQGVYLWHQPKYARNKELIDLALASGMTHKQVAEGIYLALYSKLVAEKLLGLITVIRLSGSGDLYSIDYIKVIIELAKILAAKGFRLYTYTRSYAIPTLLPRIIELAKLDNVDVNLSADKYNYELAQEVFTANPVFQRIACMQGDNATWITKMLETLSKAKLILFPIHKGKLKDKVTGKTVIKMVEPIKGLPTCPSMLGVFKKDKVADCLKCTAICHK